MRATLYPERVEKRESLGRRGQVLAGIWAGKATKQIAADLGLSPKTVEYHRAQLYRVFGVNDLVSLCRRAIAVGLIDPTSDRRKPKAGGGGRMPDAMPKAMPDAMPEAMPTHMRSEPERGEAGRSGQSRASRAAARFLGN